MRVLVAVPPISDFYTTPHRMSSLGPEVLQTILKENGHTVIVKNFPGNGIKHTIPLPAVLSYLKPFIVQGETGPLCFFTHYRQFGGTPGECAVEVAAYDPDVVCISLFAWAYAEEALLLAAELKHLCPRIPIILGGSGASVRPVYFLENSPVDYVLTGEGEDTLPLLLDALKMGTEEGYHDIPGLYWRAGTEVLLSEMPAKIPDTILPVIVPTLKIAGKQCFSVSIARGCPKQCRFCANYIIQGRKFRTVSITEIENRLEELLPTVPPSPHFNFEDDNLLTAPDYFLTVLNLFKQKFPNATFSAENGLDYQLLTAEILEKLAVSGFTQFNLSLVSTSADVLKNEERRLVLSNYEILINRARELGLPCITYFIAGFREDTVAIMAETLAYLAGKPTRIGISPFYAIPGLSGYGEGNSFQDLSPRLSLGSSMYPWNKSLSTITLITAFRLARFINYIKEGKGKLCTSEWNHVERSFKERALFTFVKEGGRKKMIPIEKCDLELVYTFFHCCPDPGMIIASYQGEF